MENQTIKKPESSKESFWELVKFALIAIIIVVPIRIFIAQPFVVSGTSMFPTFEDGDYLIVDEISYRLNKPERGDVVIFRFPNNPKKFFIKRIIGLPGEKIKIKGEDVTITQTNGEEITLDQPYVKFPNETNMTYELSDDQYFVMGDNRAGSSDSRSWGPVPKNLLIGKAFVRLFPIKHINFKPGDYNY